MITGREFAAQLMTQCDWFTGVPDSVLKSTIPHLKPYYPATRENHAVAMAFGARLGGKRPCVLMQNSGLGLCGDALIGLHHLYKVGVMIAVSARGELPTEEPQHHRWGRITFEFADVLELFPTELEAPGAIERVAGMSFSGYEMPSALLIHRGDIDESI